ncbi:MAG: hypothetical protein IKS48_05375 [Eubacterium sp.]|nr:hypothetical protein [Eubacterium sp.]
MNTLLIGVFVAVVSIVAVIIGVKNKKKALLLSEGIIGLLLIILGVSIFSASMWRSISVGFIVIGSVLDLLMIISLLSVNKRK